MTLYRIEYGDRYKDVGIEAELYDSVTDESRPAYLVPVEPCVHGNYAGHIKPTAEWVGAGPSDADWCPGAGIGDTE